MEYDDYILRVIREPKSLETISFSFIRLKPSLIFSQSIIGKKFVLPYYVCSMLINSAVPSPHYSYCPIVPF